MATSLTLTRPSRGIASRIVVAGLLTGLSDISFANATYFARRGTLDPARVFQSVASGLLGPSSFDGGMQTALLGASLHFLIAIIWTAIFVELERRSAWVRSRVTSTGRALAFGYGYGMFIWLAMNFVVIPLSRARVTPPSLPVFWIMLFGHGVFVGIPIVLLARDRALAHAPVRTRMRSGARAIE